MNYFQTKFKYILLLGLFITPSISFAQTFNPSLFGTMVTDPVSLLGDLGEITAQHMWTGVIGWIILSLGIYIAFMLAMMLISMIGTAFRNDRDKTDRVNRLADSVLKEYDEIDKRYRNS